MFFPFVVAGFGTSSCAHSGKSGGLRRAPAEHFTPCSPLVSAQLLVSVLVAGRRLQPWRGSRRDGAFQQCLGLYEGMASNERVTVLLELLGRKVRVSLDAELLIAA